MTTLGTSTTYFVNNYYEVTDGVITKYYYAGNQRIAMRKGGTLTYILGDHLGSTSLVTEAAGIVVSDTKYKAWGDTRFTSGTNPSKYTYTGQYSHMGGFGLMFYNARWYDPSLGRFASADSIVPAGVQGYDRYAYANNNPVRYTDPSGHAAWNENEGFGEGSCVSGNLVCQLDQGGYEPKMKEEIAEDLHLERPVSGAHVGVSTQKGLFMESGAYFQVDFLMDWRKGVLYTIPTFGAFKYKGTPSGTGADFYFGSSNVHGIPLYGDDDISDYLAGRNLDFAASGGADFMGKASLTWGASLDLDGTSFAPVRTNTGLFGYQYTFERSVEIGLNAAPNELDLSVESGASNSWIWNTYQIPWWH